LCHELLGDARLYALLLAFDEDLAEQARAEGCECGGRLHSAKYPRKPRGGPDNLKGYDKRFSFCCDQEGCRCRVTPPSLRFLGRRVYLGAVVVLVSAMTQGVTARRAAKLRKLVGVDRRTLERWRRWWREAFPSTPLWRAKRARFMQPVAEDELPASLLKRCGKTLRKQLLRVLKLLLPLTTTSSLARVVLGPQRTLAAGRDRDV
jgi:hypothetical protein